MTFLFCAQDNSQCADYWYTEAFGFSACLAIVQNDGAVTVC